MREVWVITACLALLEATASNHHDGVVAPDVDKEFYRLQGDLYSLSRIKVEICLLSKNEYNPCFPILMEFPVTVYVSR